MSLAPVPPLDGSLLSVSVDVAGGRVWLAGEFDHTSAHLLVDALPVLATAPGDTWTVDAAEVTFCDGGGLAALIRARDAAAARGRRLRILRASPCIRRIIDVTGTGDLLPVPPLLPVSAARPAPDAQA